VCSGCLDPPPRHSTLKHAAQSQQRDGGACVDALARMASAGPAQRSSLSPPENSPLKLSGAVQLLTKLGPRGVVQGSAPAAHYGGAVFTPETGANRRRPLRPAPGLVAALRQRLACKVGSSKGVIY
jgi:hypothetical protein